MNKLFDDFKQYATIRGGIALFPGKIALQILDKLETEHCPILGIDGFTVADNKTQPHMEHSTDLSEIDEGLSKAREFLSRRKSLPLLYEIIIGT